MFKSSDTMTNMDRRAQFSMRISTLIALTALLVSINGAIFAYLLKVEARLTRIETELEIRLHVPNER